MIHLFFVDHFSPPEHLKLGLAAHEQYYQEFKREFTQRVQTVDAQIEALQGSK